MQVLLVFVAGAIVSSLAWPVLAMPGLLIAGVIPAGDCSSVGTGTAPMYVCSAKVAALTLVGPALTMALLLIFNAAIRERVRRLARSVPDAGRFLVAPLVATVAFALAWAPGHYELEQGLVSQPLFPAVVGCFTHAMSRYGTGIRHRLHRKPLFDRWSRLPGVLRWIVALSVPLLLSFVITFQNRVSNATLKEQFVTLVALSVGFLAMTPQQEHRLTIRRHIDPVNSL